MRWHGAYGIAPIGLDFEGDTAYLVVMPWMCDADLSMYGVPKLPYLVLKRDGNEWEPVPWEARPAFLQRANLRGNWPLDGDHLPAEEVDRANVWVVRETSGSSKWTFQTRSPIGNTSTRRNGAGLAGR